jgi:hypothetical protein
MIPAANILEGPEVTSGEQWLAEQTSANKGE